ncbi:MAG: hypothetical protein V2A76_18320 [Planctomycetota bacterium]
MNQFRKVCRWLHRELGFFAIGLTLVFAISGIAVNHHRWHFDSNYSHSEERSTIQPVGTGPTALIEPMVLERLALSEPVKNTFRASPYQLKVFVAGGTIDIDLVSGEVVRSNIKKRFLLNDLNFMHLSSAPNLGEDAPESWLRRNGKTIWTTIADTFCVVLVILAISGIFLVRGRKGVMGRGGIWMLLGIAIPVVFILVMR